MKTRHASYSDLLTLQKQDASKLILNPANGEDMLQWALRTGDYENALKLFQSPLQPMLFARYNRIEEWQALWRSQEDFKRRLILEKDPEKVRLMLDRENAISMQVSKLTDCIVPGERILSAEAILHPLRLILDSDIEVKAQNYMLLAAMVREPAMDLTEIQIYKKHHPITPAYLTQGQIREEFAAVERVVDRLRFVASNEPMHDPRVIEALKYKLPIQKMTLRNIQEFVPIPFDLMNLNSELSVASAEGNAELVRSCIARGAKVDSQDTDGRTALSHASQNNKMDVVALLLVNRANPNIPDIAGATALMYAALPQYENIVKALHLHGADFNVRDSRNRTAAYYSGVSNLLTNTMHEVEYLQQAANCPPSELWDIAASKVLESVNLMEYF